MCSRRAESALRLRRVALELALQALPARRAVEGRSATLERRRNRGLLGHFASPG